MDPRALVRDGGDVRVVQRAPIVTGNVPVQSPVISAPVYVERGPPAGTIVVGMRPRAWIR